MGRAIERQSVSDTIKNTRERGSLAKPCQIEVQGMGGDCGIQQESWVGQGVVAQKGKDRYRMRTPVGVEGEKRVLRESNEVTRWQAPLR